MLNIVAFDFIQPSKLMLGLTPMDYVAIGPTGEVLGRGINKEAILATPGATGYFNLKEAASPADNKTPNFDDKPWGSVGEVQTVPGWPLIEPVKINRPDLVVAAEVENLLADEQVSEDAAKVKLKKTKAKKAK